MQDQSSNQGASSHALVYGILFTVIAVVVLVVLVLINSQADNSEQSVNVPNAAPTVDSVTISDSSYGSAATTLTLTENTTTPVYIWGIVTDGNTCEQIDTAAQYAMTFYRTNHASGAACSADDNDCYVATAATTVDQCTAGGADFTARFQFQVDANYFADATDTGATNAASDWTASVVATDDSAAASAAGTDTVEMGSLIALDVTNAIAYGSVAVGATSTEQTATITNTGNRAMDAEVSADGAMTCDTLGSIAAAQAKWSLSADFTYASAGTALSTTPTTMNNSTAQRTGATTTTDTYWKLQVPSGVAGACTNNVTFTAIADA